MNNTNDAHFIGIWGHNFSLLNITKAYSGQTRCISYTDLREFLCVVCCGDNG